MTEEKSYQKPLLSGLIYGEIAYWVALFGMMVAILGIVLYLIGINQFFDPNVLLNDLFAGKDVHRIWQDAANSQVMYGHWYMHVLAKSDAIAMLGIGICCFAGVLGAWGSVVGMIMNKERPYIFLAFAVIIALILVMSAAGMITVH